MEHKKKNKLHFQYISTDYSHASITFEELEKLLKLTKMLKLQEKVTLTQSYTTMHQKS